MTDTDDAPPADRRWDTAADATDDDGHELPPALLPALLALSSHLGLLASLLSSTILTTIYRRVVEHISNHIAQRGVFAGWSKFTAAGGADLEREVAAWISTSSLALGTAVRRPAAPWRWLEEMAKILALDDDAKDDDGEEHVGWTELLDALRLGGGASVDRLGLRVLDKTDLEQVVKRRVDSSL